jgi:ADP-ribose pyrophosphatase YjhB (NUDIX family)
MWYPHVTVATVVEKNGKFLLVREISDGLEVYNQPAGHLEAGETLVAAAVRETQEETGWLVEPQSVLALSLYTAPANGATYLRTTFIATPVHKLEDAELDADIIEAVWLTKDEIVARKSQLRSPLVLDDIERFGTGERFPLELIRHYR